MTGVQTCALPISAGRVLLFFTEKHVDIHRANRWIPVLLPAALFVLALGLQSPWVAIFYALLYGMANGMITIVKATAMATYVSRERAASLNGLLGIPTAIARAVAPSMLAGLWVATGNYLMGLAVFFVLFSGITTSIGAHLVSILRERNLPEAWVIAIPASIGALQTAGRVLLFFTEKHVDIHRANRWIPVLLPAALFVLALGLQSPWIAIFFGHAVEQGKKDRDPR